MYPLAARPAARGTGVLGECVSQPLYKAILSAIAPGANPLPAGHCATFSNSPQHFPLSIKMTRQLTSQKGVFP
jgi:hypothetical protein